MTTHRHPGNSPGRRRTAPTPPPADTADVYLVAGGDLVAVFTDADAAAVQHTVMTGANLDPITRRISAHEWPRVRARLRATNPDLTIVDARTGDDQ